MNKIIFCWFFLYNCNEIVYVLMEFLRILFVGFLYYWYLIFGKRKKNIKNRFFGSIIYMY